MWRDAYQSACAAVGVEARETISSSCRDGCLFLAGNTFDRFTNRITDADLTILIDAAAVCPEVSEIRLPYNQITEVGGRKIAVALAQGLGQIMNLDLSYNSVGSETGCEIADALKANSSLVFLSLAGNPMGGLPGQHFAGVLALNHSLVSLNLYNTEMDMKGLVYLFNALKSSSSLTTLDVGRPLLHGPSEVASVVGHLSISLKQNTSLEKLSLDHFGITDSDAYLLVLALCTSTVRTLSLRGNELSQHSGHLFARLLDRRHDFVSLNLSCNRLRDAGATDLAKGILQHPRLEALFVDHCTIGEVGLTALIAALTTVVPLRRLLLWGNDITTMVAERLFAMYDNMEEVEQTDVQLYVSDGFLTAYKA